jgi:hypothetical protein
MLVPGVMLFFAMYPVAQLIDPTLTWRQILQIDFSSGIYLFIALTLGFAYNYTPLRTISNKRYHEKVNVNLRTQALRVLPPNERDLNSYRWKDIRSIFYYFVDKDASLKNQVSRAYWNGLAWTTFADLRAIAFIFAITYAICYFSFHYITFLLYALAAFALFVVSFAFSRISTKRHMQIGDEQIGYIQVHYRQELAAKLKEVAERSD